MKLIIILLSTMFSTYAFAQSSTCYDADTSTIALEECQHDEYKRVEINLINEFQKAIQSLKQHPSDRSQVEIDKLLRSHKAWESVREKVCTEEVAEREGGTSQGFAKAECLTQLTQRRLEFVQSLKFSR